MDFFRLCLLTGLRREEAGKLEWSRDNLLDRTFWLPDSKSGKPNYLPMTDWVYGMLSRRSDDRSHPVYVFGSHDYGKSGGYLASDNGSSNEAEYVALVREQTGDAHASPLPHDLRGYMCSTLGMVFGLPERLINAIINDVCLRGLVPCTIRGGWTPTRSGRTCRLTRAA